MPVPAIFTSSAGGDIGGAGLIVGTRFRGPIRVGPMSSGGATVLDPGVIAGNISGTAGVPFYSFSMRPDMGMYAFSITSSAPDLRFSQAGVDYVSLSSAGARLASTAAVTAVPDFVWASTVGALSTAAQTGYFYCPGTSQTLAGATPPIPLFVATSGINVPYAVPMAFDVTNKKLWFYTTVSSWIGLGGSTSGATLWTTSS